jgi:hypothetical protein
LQIEYFGPTLRPFTIGEGLLAVSDVIRPHDVADAVLVTEFRLDSIDLRECRINLLEQPVLRRGIEKLDGDIDHVPYRLARLYHGAQLGVFHWSSLQYLGTSRCGEWCAVARCLRILIRAAPARESDGLTGELLTRGVGLAADRTQHTSRPGQGG